jgi:hypothetical protein
VDACVVVDLPPDPVENTAHPLGARAAARAAAVAAIAAERLAGVSSSGNQVSSEVVAQAAVQVQAEVVAEGAAAEATVAAEAARNGNDTGTAAAEEAGRDKRASHLGNGVAVGLVVVAPVPCAVLRDVTGELKVRFTQLRLESAEETKTLTAKPAASTA